MTLRPPQAFVPALRTLTGPVQVDRKTAPLAVLLELQDAGVEAVDGDDPCRLPKACKTAAEIAGMRDAHLRDGAAMVEFLTWLDAEAPKGGLTEIDVVTALEASAARPMRSTTSASTRSAARVRTARSCITA